MKLYYEIKNINDCDNLQRNLNSLLDWCETNALPINASKCYVLSFNRKDFTIRNDYKIENFILNRQSR